MRILIPMVGLILALQKPVAQEAMTPNILIITVDDLGWSDLGCYGSDLHETPNIDALARESFLFSHSYAAAPVCSPTRASMLSGKTPANLQLTIWIEAAAHERRARENRKYITPQTMDHLPLSEITLAELVKEKNYLTAHVGKWHLGDLMHFPETQGFDISFAASQRGAPPTFFYPYRGHAFGEYRFVTDMARDASGKYFADRQGEYLTDRLTDEAIKIISDAGDQPFFLNLSYYSVHTPIEAKADEVEYFRQKLDSSAVHKNAVYAAMVKSIDDNVGRILQMLKSKNIFDNTLILVTSDNGGFVNEYRNVVVTNNAPLRSGKGSLYEGGIRIPTIIAAPFLQRPPRIIESPISTIDYLPTICDLLQIEVPNGVEGRSFWQALKDTPGDHLVDRPLYWHYPHYYPTTTPVSAIRVGDWKLIEYLGEGQLELFNLREDLGETENLASTFVEERQMLQDQLHAWKSRVKAGNVTLRVPDK